MQDPSETPAFPNFSQFYCCDAFYRLRRRLTQRNSDRPPSAAEVKCSSVFERWKSRPIHCIRMSTGAKILRRGVQCGKLCLFVPRCVHHGRSVPAAVIPSPLAVNLPVASRLVQYPEFGATFESFLAPQNNSMQRAVLLQYLLNSYVDFQEWVLFCTARLERRLPRQSGILNLSVAYRVGLGFSR